eukprot:1159098-Pelagomonas_calceolata.AAC.7
MSRVGQFYTFNTLSYLQQASRAKKPIIYRSSPGGGPESCLWVRHHLPFKVMWVEMLPIKARTDSGRRVSARACITYIRREAGGTSRAGTGEGRGLLRLVEMKIWRKGVSEDQKPVCMRRKNAVVRKF